MATNEYDEIYGEDNDIIGFEFNYGGGRIGKSKPLYESDVAERSFGNANSELMFVRCSKCGKYMDFDEGVNMFDSYWRCSECSTRVRESTAYNQLERENDKFLKDGDLNE